MKKILLIALVFVAGCGEGDKASRINPAPRKSRINREFIDSLLADEQKAMLITKVTSDPSGARIEVNEDYLGVTPLEIQWNKLSDTRVITGSYTQHKVVALPIYQGQYVQTKWIYGDRIPKTIFFDMSLHPMTRRYKIDLD